MNKFFKMFFKSLCLGIVVNFLFVYIFSLYINSGDIVGLINGFSIISVLFFCTFLIIDEIRKLRN